MSRINRKRSVAVAGNEPIVRRCLDSGIAVQHADDGRFGRVNVCNMVLIYAPDGTKAMAQELERLGMGSV